MKVWYKNVGDTKPTLLTYGNEARPGEYFFEADPVLPRHGGLCTIRWAGGVPTLVSPSKAKKDSHRKAVLIKQCKENLKTPDWETAIIALRNELKGGHEQVLDDIENAHKKRKELRAWLGDPKRTLEEIKKVKKDGIKLRS